MKTIAIYPAAKDEHTFDLFASDDGSAKAASHDTKGSRDE